MVKPDCCQSCQRPFSPGKLQAHHHDYNKPLDVSWYCDSCHKKIHQELGVNWKTITGSVVTQIINIQTRRTTNDTKTVG